MTKADELAQGASRVMREALRRQRQHFDVTHTYFWKCTSCGSRDQQLCECGGLVVAAGYARMPEDY